MGPSIVHVHFVCAGNVYRSRLAEALLNSHCLPGLRVSSSGVRAAENLNGPISWTAMRLLKRAGLVPYMSPHWTQTTPALLAEAGLVIFLDPACNAACADTYGYAGAREVWDVPDVNDPRYPEQRVDSTDEPRLMQVTEQTFERLRREVDALAGRLRSGTYTRL